MSLTLDDVNRLALLARIEISAPEAVETLTQLNRIFGLIEQMRAVDTQGIEPMSQAQDLMLRLREDKVMRDESRELFQSVAPEVENGLYLVPKVIE